MPNRVLLFCRLNEREDGTAKGQLAIHLGVDLISHHWPSAAHPRRHFLFIRPPTVDEPPAAQFPIDARFHVFNPIRFYRFNLYIFDTAKPIRFFIIEISPPALEAHTRPNGMVSIVSWNDSL